MWQDWDCWRTAGNEVTHWWIFLFNRCSKFLNNYKQFKTGYVLWYWITGQVAELVTLQQNNLLPTRGDTRLNFRAVMQCKRSVIHQHSSRRKQYVTSTFKIRGKMTHETQFRRLLNSIRKHCSTLWRPILLYIFTDSVRTVSMTTTNWFTRFKEIITVYSENHTKHTRTLCGQNAELLTVEVGGTYSYHWVLKG
jgi:hypothetical protein